MTTVATPITPETTAKKPAVVRPEKPDEEAFKKASEEKQKEHDAIRQKLNEVKAKIESTKPGGRDPRQQEIRDQLNSIKSQVATKKGNRGKIEDQIKSLQDSINTRVKELQAKQKAIPYRSVADLEAAVAKLDANVSSGKMKIVDEKRALAEISSLNKQKRNFGTFEETQKTIDADKARLKELKEKKQDPELVELNKQYEILQAELNELRASQDSVHKNINALRDERTQLQKEQNEKWDELKKIRDDYHQNRIAFREYSKEARRIKDEKFQKQRQEQENARKKAIAEERMEAASQPAYQTEIVTCEGLIGFFDPSSAEAARKAKNVTGPRELAAKAQRTVDATALKGKPLVREEEDYFIGGNTKKKGKKGRQTKAEATEASGEAPAASGKLNLNYGTLEELSRVGVETPASQAGVAKTLEDLRNKLQWYKDNQDKVTKENIAKAKKELEKFEAEGDGPEIPAADAVKTDNKTDSGAATPAVEAEESKKEEKPAEEKVEEEAPAAEAPAAEEEGKEE